MAHKLSWVTVEIFPRSEKIKTSPNPVALTFLPFHIILVTRVNQDHWYNVIQFALDSTILLQIHHGCQIHQNHHNRHNHQNRMIFSSLSFAITSIKKKIHFFCKKCFQIESEIDPRQLNYMACFGTVLTRLRPLSQETVERIKRRNANIKFHVKQ